MEAVSSGNIRTRHVCGENPTRNFGISTSAIQEFDMVAMTVKTRSGKTYTLAGLPNNSRLGDGAWRKWCNDNGTVADRDVTGEYLKADQPTEIIKTVTTNSDSPPTIKFKRLGFR
jgi:hypothetical protein